MSAQDTLRLERLELTNFRCFAECAIDLHPELTVLVADNGKGKTALLDAIGIALGLFVDTVANTHQWHGFERDDVHRVRVYAPGKPIDGKVVPYFPARFLARGVVDGHPVQWSRALERDVLRAKTTTRDAARLRKIAEGLRGRLTQHATGKRDMGPVLPIVALYGTGRLWSEHRLTAEKRKQATNATILGRTAGYSDCLSSSSSFKAFLAWYEQTANAARDAQIGGATQAVPPERLLATVNEAIRTVLAPTGWKSLVWDYTHRQLLVEHPEHHELPLAFLSDGVRTMIALVADIAHRCVRLNPQWGIEAAKFTPGIVLIDEVDMHLHPGWQQSVIGLLREAFPKIQFVVTTHSPQVLSTVDVESIRVLRVKDGVGALETPKYQTRGVESASVLAVIMGIDPIAQVPEAQWVSRYQALIADGKVESDEAKALRVKLLEHFGAGHPVMINSDRLARFQAYKLRQPSPPMGVAER